jgi:hypothetical protein
MDLKISSKDRLIEIIDRACSDDNLPVEVKMGLKEISDKDKSVYQLQQAVNLITREISSLKTGSASDPRELSTLLELRAKLLKNDNRVWQKSKDALNQDLEVVNKKIQDINVRMTKWRDDVQFFNEALEYLQMELEIEKLK